MGWFGRFAFVIEATNGVLMIMASYRSKYIKTYIWSGLSLILNFLSMFIVAPLTTSMPEVYGVYSLCISFNIFLKYADLGFISAGRKYAAEAHAVSDYNKEKKYVGSAMSIYGIMSLIFFAMGVFFSFYPALIIKDIDHSPYYSIASQLLLILAFTCPFSIIQKYTSLIYSIRIEEYKIQGYQIVGSVIKIASVPLYFFNERYDIVGYYLFSELINVIINIWVLHYSKTIGYGIRQFLYTLKIDKNVFNEIRPLAFSGFASVLSWVAYYELDTIGVSILLGAHAVAVYAVGKQIQNFVRSLVGILLSPYPVRINYFVGQKDIEGLKNFYYRVSSEFSFIIIPIIVLALFAKPFIYAWVGSNYEDAVPVLQLLVLTFILNHISTLACNIIYALNKVKDILKLALYQPVLFWGGILISYKYIGIESFSTFKFIACIVIEFYYCILVSKYLEFNKKQFFSQLIIYPIISTGFVCVILRFLFTPILEDIQKGHADLLLVAAIMAFCCFVAFCVSLVFNKPLKEDLVNVYITLKKRI